MALLAEQATGARSKWAAYLAALPPPEALNCPVLWTEDEFSALRETSVHKMMIQPNDDAQEVSSSRRVSHSAIIGPAENEKDAI